MSTIQTHGDTVPSRVMDKQAVGAMVQQAWLESGVPQKEMLANAGISRTHFNNIAKARYPEGPSTDFLDSVARALGGYLLLDIVGPGRPRVTVALRPDLASLIKGIEMLLDGEAQDALATILFDEKARTMFVELLKTLAAGVRGTGPTPSQRSSAP